MKRGEGRCRAAAEVGALACRCHVLGHVGPAGRRGQRSRRPEGPGLAWPVRANTFQSTPVHASPCQFMDPLVQAPLVLAKQVHAPLVSLDEPDAWLVGLPPARANADLIVTISAVSGN